MKKQKLAIAYFSTNEISSFEASVHALLMSLDFGSFIPIRFVFYGSPRSDFEYFTHLKIIKEKMYERFGMQSPVFSYVSQKPLCESTLVLEVHQAEISNVQNVRHHQQDTLHYITIEDENSKSLSMGGIMAESAEMSTFEQATQIFQTINKILEKEKLPIQSIVRQWNYISSITALKGDRQNYQEFNDARSHFYNQTIWERGYPAATGIGTMNGGVVVDLFAVAPKSENVKLCALNNKLQVAAHAYSQQVLIGQEDQILKMRGTPKFERGKVVHAEGDALIYISGTAAIRGEESLATTDIEAQTIITLENIAELIAGANLNEVGVKSVEELQLNSLRIYLKKGSDFNQAKNIVERVYPNTPAIYLLGEICRDNLLIEIEGVATINC
jgi:enamine deaminase RidA (YjgF/YER057c/UK114 family)